MANELAGIDSYERELENLYTQGVDSIDQSAVTLRTRNMRLLRRRSFQLRQFMDGDWASMVRELRTAFPSQSAKMPIRIYKLLSKIACDLATLYATPPRRKFFGPGGAAVSLEVFTKFNEIYANSRIDRVLLNLHRHLISQQTQVLLVLPSGPRKVYARVCHPYQVFVTPGNALQAADIGTAKEVRIKLPVASTDLQQILGWAVFTPKECYWLVDGVKSSIFNRNDANDIRNPWPGTIPLVAIHAVEPPDGCFLSGLADDLYHEQIGVNLAVSHLEHQLRHSSPIKVIEPGDAGGLTTAQAEGLNGGGNDDWIALPGIGSRLATVHSSPPTAEYRGAIDWQIALSATLNNMAPDAFVKSPAAKTAVSRAYDRADRAETRKDFAGLFLPFEQELGDLIAKVANLDSGEAIVLPVNPLVKVEYIEPDDSPADPVHEMQAKLMAYRSGQANAIDDIARSLGVTPEEAAKKFDENLAIAAKLLGDAGNINTAPVA